VTHGWLPVLVRTRSETCSGLGRRVNREQKQLSRSEKSIGTGQRGEVLIKLAGVLSGAEVPTSRN
jgi:hypothetical protein